MGGMPFERCQRYRADGSPCAHHTDYRDGWCRESDCPGYTRPDITHAPESLGPMRGTRKHLAESGHVPVADGDVEPGLVRVTQRALDSFRFHHGGSEREAETQLRSMLEDFLLQSARSTRTGVPILSRDGY